MTLQLQYGDTVRWSTDWLRTLGIEPNPDRPWGWVVKRWQDGTIEVCYEMSNPKSVQDVHCSADQLELKEKLDA